MDQMTETEFEILIYFCFQMIQVCFVVKKYV